uniref:Uncharacterized protein n=1 Tax=Helianthus annuus TaxID=4232 RepID=A0A251S7S0_HELAN
MAKIDVSTIEATVREDDEPSANNTCLPSRDYVLEEEFYFFRLKLFEPGFNLGFFLL